MGMLDALIYGVRNLFSGGSALALVSDLNFTGGLKGAYNATTDAVDVSLDTSVPLPLTGGVILGSQTPPQYQASAFPSVQTTDGSGVLLGQVQLPAAAIVGVRAVVTARLYTAANGFGYMATASGVVWRVGSGSPQGPGIIDPSFVVLGPALPFSATAGQPGSIAFGLAGNTLSINGIGIGAPMSWSAGPFARGALVTRGGNVYIVSSIAGSGTSTTGPSGTGTGQVDDAGANEVVWDWVATGTSVPITWTLCKLEVFAG